MMTDTEADKLQVKCQNLQKSNSLRQVTYPMDNHGNTCFFNAVMQCLTHTVPFHQYCLTQTHQSQCRCPVSDNRKQYCYQCGYSKFIIDLNKYGRTNPRPIIEALTRIWHGYRIGQQRDAHEFLTIYLEAILNASFSEVPSRAHVIKKQAFTPLFKIFGGILRSQITCERCNYKSDTFDETFTLNLPLPRDQEECTFQNSLSQFFSVDRLTKDNKYLCPKCKSRQNATKRLSVNQAPRILIVTIKRFDILGRKIGRAISYPAAFNLKSFTSSTIDKKTDVQIPNEIYDLYGVVIHQGASTNCGHYYACCKGNEGKWYNCNDSFIEQMSESKALNKQAYLLFY